MLHPLCMCWWKLPYSFCSVDSRPLACVSAAELPHSLDSVDFGPRNAEACGQSACPTPPRIQILGGVGHAGRIMGCQIVSNLSMPNTPRNPPDSWKCSACLSDRKCCIPGFGQHAPHPRESCGFSVACGMLIVSRRSGMLGAKRT